MDVHSVYACRALLNALAPLIGAEISLGNKAVKEGWAADVSSDTLQSWRTTAVEQTQSEMERILQETCAVEYNLLLRKRLALRLRVDGDQSEIFHPLLDMMERQRLDFHGTFRKLSGFRREMVRDENGEKTGALETFIGSLLQGTPEPDQLDYAQATEQWLGWLGKYADRIDRETSEWVGEPDYDAARERAVNAANPRFVLRQWLLEEVIKKVETDPATGKRVLAKVLKVHVSLVLTSVQGTETYAHRWLVPLLSRGAPRATIRPTASLTQRLERRGGTVVWERSGCWASNAAARAEL